MSSIARFLPYMLLLVSAALILWGILGLLEYCFPAVKFGLQNAQFPAGLQFLHFFSILVTGAIFVTGYLKHWPFTPYATITMYAVLATLCFIETLDFGAFGGGATGVLIMTMEFALYVGLSIYLLRSSTIHHHFQAT